MNSNRAQWSSKKSLLLITVFLAGVATIIGSGSNPPGPNLPPPFEPGPPHWQNFIELDFEPIDSTNYDLACTGDHMDYSDAKMFRLNIRLEEPAQTGITLPFLIMEEGTTSQPTIGYVTVRFEPGGTRPFTVITENVQSTVETFMGMNIHRMPTGAPTQESGAFWLGCTMSCQIRGNGPAGETAAHNIWLEPAATSIDDGSLVLGITGLVRTPTHPVQCLME